MPLLDVLHGGQQHAAGAAGRVVDGLGLLGIEHVDHQPHNAARGVELARLLVGGVGELLDQVFIGVTDQVGRDVVVAQRERGKMLDQVLEQRVRQPFLVRPLRVTEYTVECVRVGLFDSAQRMLQGGADVGRFGTDVDPVAVLRELKAVRFRKPRQLFVTCFIDDLLVFLIPDIADALEEQQRKDVGLEVGRVHRATQDVGGFPEVTFKLIEGDSLFAQTCRPASSMPS